MKLKQVSVLQKGIQIVLLVVLALTLSACATSPKKRVDSLVEQEQWLKAVLELRKAYNKDPGNVEYKSRLRQVELKAADYYYQRGLKLERQGDLDAAIVQYQQGLTAMPDHGKLTKAMKDILSRKESDRIYQEGQRNAAAGKLDQARKLYTRALELYPNQAEAKKALAKLTAKEDAARADKLVLSSKNPITLNFRHTNLKTAFEFVAKSFGLNVIFDDEVKDAPVTLFAQGVTFDQALNLMLTTTETFYKRIGPNTILIAPDTTAKRGQYEDYIIRTFQLTTIKAKEMAEILKGMLDLKKVVINTELNTLLIRDTEEKIKLAEQLISTNDRKSAEIIFDVEILEVNRTKSEQLGLDFGSQISAAYPTFTIGSAFSSALSNGVVTLPNTTFNFFKQDVDAKVLANPKIRVLDGKSAKIHIGDRVPLRSATIQDATGQIRNTYDYKDIGVRLDVTPEIHLDNSSTVKLSLEVSSLGANLGTKDDPAYSIGTRNADTVMLLRDGETAILGGLIRDEDRKNRVRIPGVGDIPVVGNVFKTRDDSDSRTDVLLTITARVVRSWDLPKQAKLALYSGTEKSYSSKPLFAYLNKPGGPATPRISLEQEEQGAQGNSSAQTLASNAPQPDSAILSTQPTLTFSQGVYNADSGQEFDIQLVAANLGDVKSVPIDILYNPQLTQFIKGEPGSAKPTSFKAEAEDGKGVLHVNIQLADKPGKPGEPMELATIRLKGLRPGISYLVYRTPALKTADNKPVAAQLRASRVLIK